MKQLFTFTFLLHATVFFAQVKNQKSPFNGINFNGFEGDTLNSWHIENGMITGGSLESSVPKNDFLCLKKPYSNFKLKLKIKLTGTEGFINSGIQFRSQRLAEPAHEMTGYQADFGKNYYASLYDESRRNKTIAAPDSATVLTWIKPNGWNSYEIRAKNRRIRLYINGHKSVDYIEQDLTIPQQGLIGFQIHGGGKAKVYFKDIELSQ